jgi:hypothetical protein
MYPGYAGNNDAPFSVVQIMINVCILLKNKTNQRLITLAFILLVIMIIKQNNRIGSLNSLAGELFK